MKFNVFTYYGALVPKSEVTSHMVQFNQRDMYSYIVSKGLQYRKYGNVATDFRIVVGKEISAGITDNPKSSVVEKGHIIMCPKNKDVMRLHSSEEQRIREALLQIGVYEDPKYYVFANWEA